MNNLANYKLSNSENRRFLYFYFSFTLIGLFLACLFGLGWFFLFILIRHLLLGLTNLYIYTLGSITNEQIADLEKARLNENGNRIFRSTKSMIAILIYVALTTIVFSKINISLWELIQIVMSQ